MTGLKRIASIALAIILTPMLLVLWPILVLAVAIIKPTTPPERELAD